VAAMPECLRKVLTGTNVLFHRRLKVPQKLPLKLGTHGTVVDSLALSLMFSANFAYPPKSETFTGPCFDPEYKILFYE